MLKGIDVSVWNGNINFDKLKTDFVIIRCGYGDDIEKQDDKFFKNNIEKCKAKNIPYGVYLYSYAKSLTQIESEVNHVLRLINGYNPFCVYIDMEDNSTVSLGKSNLTSFAIKFCNMISGAGYKAGVYANANWFKNYIDASKLKDYSLWIAQYSSKAPTVLSNYDIWQYASDGKAEGITGNVDVNYMVNDIINVTVQKSIEDLAEEVIANKWGTGVDRKNRLTSAGYDYNAVQSKVNEILSGKKSNDEIAKEVIKGLWGNGKDRKNRLTAAGYDYNKIQELVNKLL